MPGFYTFDEKGNRVLGRQAEGMPRVVSTDYLQEIAEGEIPGHFHFAKNGYSAAIGTSQSDLWELGGTYVFPAAGGIQMRIKSGGNVGDAAAGTGIRTVELHYLDANYVEHEETITLNGVAAVNTVAANILRVQRFHAVTAGSGGAAAGNIDLTNVAESVTYARISTGMTSSLQAIWTVPAGHSALITNWRGSGAKSTGTPSVLIKLRATVNEKTPTDGVFQLLDNVLLIDATESITFPIPIRLPEKVDLKVAAISSAASTEVSARFGGWYEKNGA